MTSRTILVIDADSETEQLIASALESEGYLVFAVPGGDVGTEMAQKVSPSLIFINPDETGLELCNTIRGFESLQRVPIVLLGSASERIDSAARAAFGIADTLKIPFTAAELLEKTAKVLNTKSPIVLHVKEKGPKSEVEETALPDFLEEPVAKKSSDFAPKVTNMTVETEFDESPGAEDILGEGDVREPANAYIHREASRHRKKRGNFPIFVAAAGILVIGFIAGALFYLGLIPGIGTKKAAPVKPIAAAVKPKAQPPAANPAATPVPTPIPAPAPENELKRKESVVQNKAVGAPSMPVEKAPPAPSFPTPSKSVKKEPSTRAAAAPEPSPKVKHSGKPLYSVQLGVFKSEGNAAVFTKKIKGKGYDAFMVKSIDKRKGTLYRVLVGKSTDRKGSAKLASEIRDKEKVKAVIYSE